jgi:hypothetical protein
MGLFRQYLDSRYPGTSWLTKNPDELGDAFYEFLGDAANGPAADAYAKENRAMYDLYRTEVDKNIVKTKSKLQGLANAPVAQQPIQRANHIRLLVDSIDDKADRIVMPGRHLLLAQQQAQRQAAEEAIFNGAWQPNIDNTIPVPAAVNCNTYNLKHFGSDSKAAQYLGRFKDYKLVKALEEKAKSALLLEACIFRFRENVGHDGTNRSESPMTNCIRVDSIGSGMEHSHPIPQSGVGSHDAYVKDSIIKCNNANDMEGLIDVAKYLTIIGARKGEFTFSNKEKDKLTGRKFNRHCTFWNPQS